MAVEDLLVTLIISSTEMSVDEISATLDMLPSHSHRAGQTLPSRSGGKYENNQWSFRIDSDDIPVEERSEDGMSALRALIRRFHALSPELVALRSACETEILWTLNSDTLPVSFAFDEEVMVALGAMGCALLPTIYLDE